MEKLNKTITLKVQNANEMNAYVAYPEVTASAPAILVLQEAFGVNHHIREVTERIASEGYVAIAPELFHRTAAPGEEFSYNDFPKVMPHMQALTPEGMENDFQAVYDWLNNEKKVQKENVGAIGFCMGGRASFIANTYLPLKAAVSFYGGGTHTLLHRIEKMSGPHLFFWGGKDKHILPEHRDAITNALRISGKDFINVEISYADHAFFCNERPAYHPEAAAEAWGMVKTFLGNKLKNKG